MGARWRVGVGGDLRVERWMGVLSGGAVLDGAASGGTGEWGRWGWRRRVLFGELGDGRVVLVVPLVDVGAGMRCLLEGGVEGGGAGVVVRVGGVSCVVCG